MRHTLISLTLFALVALMGCDDTESNTNNDTTCANPWTCEDPEGRTTEGNMLGTGPVMLIVTSEELAEKWQEYADVRSMQGVYTEVVTMTAVREAAEGADDAEKLRTYLRHEYETGNLQYALLGGDADQVPFRRVENEISIVMTGDDYASNAPSQLYFTNLEVDFDGDGDGTPGERDEDFGVEEARVSHIAVGRISVETLSELTNYMNKYDRYATMENDHITAPLLFSDIAAVTDITGPIDGAEGIEPTVESFFPQEFKDNARRLYATQDAVDTYGGELLTYTRLQNALIEGYPFLFHNGHGSHETLATAIDIGVVTAFQNELPFVLLSCACLAGNFADMDEGFVPQPANDDSVSEIMMYDYYGAIAYVGNTAVGLGAWGGSQFLHAMTKALFEDHADSIGDAFNYARANLASIEYLISGVPPSLLQITEEREWWTQQVLILMGDPSLRVHTGPLQDVTIEAPDSYGPGYQQMTVTVTDEQNAPVSGAVVTLSKEGDFYINELTDASGSATFAFIPTGRRALTIGVTGRGLRPATTTVASE